LENAHSVSGQTPTFQRPRRQTERLPIILHRTLNTHHSSGRLQSTNAHAPLHIRHEHLILESTNRLLEGLALALKASVTVNFGTEGTITKLPDGLIYVIIPYVVSIEELENIGGDERGSVADDSSLRQAKDV
jgi:hypothetical protein